MTVTCTRDGLFINDQPFYLLSAQIHYFRYPRAEWRDILLSAKAGGINTVDTVIPWNLHEPRRNEFEFSDMADLATYIDLCGELGLYFIARPCPYICAEWENGGLPAWLANDPDMAYRLDNPSYLTETLRWFDTLIPMLTSRQFDLGGPIILVQIENEHWASGVYGHDAHQDTLAAAMRERGITLPFYTCVGAGREWPEFRNGWTGIAQKLAQTRRIWPDNPMIVSELWSGWFDDWGSSHHNGKPAAELDWCLHELQAVGAAGFSHWMWAGGTNFGYWGGRTVGGDTIHNTTSYDCDAPVSEYGGLTEKYFVSRRHHLFLATLGSRLAKLLTQATDGGVKVLPPKAIAGRAVGGSEPFRNVRQGDFTATYLRNDSLSRQIHQLYLPDRHFAIEVEAMSIKPIFTHLPLSSELILQYHTGRILAFWSLTGRDILVLYGFEGEMGQVALKGGTWHINQTDGTTCQVADDTLHVNYWLTDRPTIIQATIDGRPLQIVLLTQARAERCWLVGEHGLLVGPHALYSDGLGVMSDELKTAQNSSLHFDQRGVTPFYWLGAEGQREQIVGEHQAGGQDFEPLQFTRYETAELTDNDGWQPLAAPMPFEALGCDLGYGWYRAKFTTPPSPLTPLPLGEGQTTPPLTPLPLGEGQGVRGLTIPRVSDRGHLYVDGIYRGTYGISPNGPTLSLPMNLAAGEHELRLLVDNLGRFNYGSGLGEHKGLTDTLYWGGEQTDITQGWTAMWQEAYFAGDALAKAHPAHVRPDAENVDLANFAFSGTDVWLMREFHVPANHRAMLYITGDRNPGALYVNGQCVTRFSRHYGGGFHKYDVTKYLNAKGANETKDANLVNLYIRDYGGLPWRAWLLTYPEQPIQAEWSFRGGVTPFTPPLIPPLTQGGAGGGMRPHFYRAEFAYDATEHGDGPFKVSLFGLHKGQLWLNGHHLGRYWQIGPQEFYKVPTSWLLAENELLIFEEENGSPQEVRLWVDNLAARRLVVKELGIRN